MPENKTEDEPSLPTWLVAAVAMQMIARQSFCPSRLRRCSWRTSKYQNEAQMELLRCDFCKPRKNVEDVSLPVRLLRASQ